MTLSRDTLHTSTLPVNGVRLNASIDELARIGALPDGSVRRLAFSPEDIQARQLVREWMRAVDMSVRVDAAGNLIGRYAGREDLPALATGSHLDTVERGGRYDGVYGVLAGLELARSLHERGLRLRHPFEVIVFTDEENTIIGSKAMAGHASRDANSYKVKDGTDIQTCLQRLGGEWELLETARRDRRDIAAFVELHVEQGSVLETAHCTIGVVEGIVCQQRYEVTIEGQANHAGTTPMPLRQDALVAAARVVLAVDDLARHLPGQQVATVGSLNVTPNATNIVPGFVSLSVDIRDLSANHVEFIVARLQERLEQIAADTQTRISKQVRLRLEPTLAAAEIQNAIARSADRLGLKYCYLPSRAGHDAQEMGRFTDMGMIFVPSAAGISHAASEYTSPEQCTQGANVLMQTILQLDKRG
ncbi:MAG: Zn-dependent hydrolase [Cyanobacteria bacterium J06642_2]